MWFASFELSTIVRSYDLDVVYQFPYLMGTPEYVQYEKKIGAFYA